MWEEKRRSLRRPVCVNIDTFPDPIPLGRLVNVSEEGLFVQTTNVKEVGTQMDLCFTLPGSSKKVRLAAEVMWVNYPPSSEDLEGSFSGTERYTYKNPGMGLRLVSMSSEDRKLMEGFIQRNTV